MNAFLHKGDVLSATSSLSNSFCIIYIFFLYISSIIFAIINL